MVLETKINLLLVPVSHTPVTLRNCASVWASGIVTKTWPNYSHTSQESNKLTPKQCLNVSRLKFTLFCPASSMTMSIFLLLWGDAVGSRCSLWILYAAQELNRLRSRSVSRRSVPAGSAVDGSPSRMRSRSAHREQDLQSRVSQAAAHFLHHFITNDCFHSALWKQRA